MSLLATPRPWTREWFVEGEPAPGGSKTFFPMWNSAGQLVTEMRNGRPWPIIRVTDDAGERNKIWRRIVGFNAKAFWKLPPSDGAFEAQFIFYLRRPKSHYGTGRNENILKESAPVYHLQKPDALKLARSTEDALTGIVWVDDSHVVKGPAPEKRWAGLHEKTGAIIRVRIL